MPTDCAHEDVCHKGANEKESESERRTLSRKPSSGTGVPHLRSRVMHRGLRPSRIQSRVMALALMLHALPPASMLRARYSPTFGSSCEQSLRMRHSAFAFACGSASTVECRGTGARGIGIRGPASILEA